MAVYKDKEFCEWGKHWIDGTDRSEAAARAAEAAWAAEAGSINLHELAIQAISYK